MARSKTPRKKATKKKATKKAPARRRTPAAATSPTPPTPPTPPAAPQGERTALALPHSMRDAMVETLRKKMPMEDAEGIVNMLRQLPEVRIQ